MSCEISVLARRILQVLNVLVWRFKFITTVKIMKTFEKLN